MSCNFASSSRFFFCIDDKKMLTANMPKAHHVTCTTGTVKQVLNLFYSFAVNVVWKFINLLVLCRVIVSKNECLTVCYSFRLFSITAVDYL